jgi:hypothetical protein
MILSPLVAFVALMLQTTEAGSSALERRKAVLIEEIESAAVVEPPVFGIDTQIRAAEILVGRDDAHAVRFLRDAGQRTLLLADPATRSHFLKRIVPSLTPLDAGRAESFCGAQSRTEPALKADPLAVCYDQLIATLKDWSLRKDALGRALAAGAYDLPNLDLLLNDARDHHRSDFVSLLSAFVGAFPQLHPRLEEIERLESIDHKYAAGNSALSRQARRMAAAARREFAADRRRQAGQESASNEKPGPDAGQAASSGGTTVEPLEQPKSDFPAFNLGFHLPSLLEIDDPQLGGLPEVSKLGTEEAIRLAQRQEYPGARAAILADVLDEKDAELEPRRKMSLAEEVLRDSQKMRLSSARLIIQAQLARWFHQGGELLKAGEAALALQTSFDSLVQCQGQSCNVFGTNVDNSPGELIMSFAEYLKKYNIDPAELGLNHPGLRARWLLLELQSLLEDKQS